MRAERSIRQQTVIGSHENETQLVTGYHHSRQFSSIEIMSNEIYHSMQRRIDARTDASAGTVVNGLSVCNDSECLGDYDLRNSMVRKLCGRAKNHRS